MTRRASTVYMFMEAVARLPARDLLISLLSAVVIVQVLAPSRAHTEDIPKAAPLPPAAAVQVEVVARLTDPGSAAWSATARVGSVAVPSPNPGECRPEGPAAHEADGPVVDGIRVTGPTRGDLTWDELRSQWRLAGPQRSADPTWGVGDVELTVDGTRTRATEAIRFGAAPQVQSVERDPVTGSVTLTWDPQSMDVAQVRVEGPAGLVVCGTSGAGLTLPWWAVPAKGGLVVLRSTRERWTGLGNGVVVQVRAAIERVVPLDEPREQAREQAPGHPAPDPRPKGPRYSNRPPPGIFG